MISFESDYTTGAHPEILHRLIESNFEHMSGYGSDRFTESAKTKIAKMCNCSEQDVFLLTGGTQTNSVVISTLLRDYEGVVAADTGHVALHEAGAIEYTGHKVLTIPHMDGKIEATALERYLDIFYGDDNHEHMVFPGMVYVSYPTENGTLYTKQELSDIHDICVKYDIPLFVDGARLGYGLMSEASDMTIEDIAKLCDVFYIGGTKVGALFGEAVVITDKELLKNFRYCIKQRGGLLAKGRLLGIQFEELFSNDLYFNISKHAVDMAMMIKESLKSKGYNFLYDSNTNQQFPIFPNDVLEKLSKKYVFSFWEKVDEKNSAVRICTSYATKLKDVHELIQDIENL